MSRPLDEHALDFLDPEPRRLVKEMLKALVEHPDVYDNGFYIQKTSNGYEYFLAHHGQPGPFINPQKLPVNVMGALEFYGIAGPKVNPHWLQSFRSFTEAALEWQRRYGSITPHETGDERRPDIFNTSGILNNMMRDTVVLLKPNGTRVEGIKASVQREKIFVTDGSLPIEEGDIIVRDRPGGLVERYTVLDAGYFAETYRIPAHFQMQVRKETAIPREPPGPTNNYYLTGPNSRINNNSMDASVNISLTQATTQLFDDLRAALNEIAGSEERERLIVDVQEMEATQGSPSFLSRYQAFMEHASNHMTVLGPFLPALSQLLV